MFLPFKSIPGQNFLPKWPTKDLGGYSLTTSRSNLKRWPKFLKSNLWIQFQLKIEFQGQFWKAHSLSFLKMTLEVKNKASTDQNNESKVENYVWKG